MLRHATNLGQGAALQTAIDHALTIPEITYLITFDADGQHQLTDALAMVHLAREENLAVVFGSRFLDERTQGARGRDRAGLVYPSAGSRSSPSQQERTSRDGSDG